jgi:hypothetical protein
MKWEIKLYSIKGSHFIFMVGKESLKYSNRASLIPKLLTEAPTACFIDTGKFE